MCKTFWDTQLEQLHAELKLVLMLFRTVISGEHVQISVFYCLVPRPWKVLILNKHTHLHKNLLEGAEVLGRQSLDKLINSTGFRAKKSQRRQSHRTPVHPNIPFNYIRKCI